MIRGRWSPKLTQVLLGNVQAGLDFCKADKGIKKSLSRTTPECSWSKLTKFHPSRYRGNSLINSAVAVMVTLLPFCLEQRFKMCNADTT